MKQTSLIACAIEAGRGLSSCYMPEITLKVKLSTFQVLHQPYFIMFLVILTVPLTCQKDTPVRTVDTAPLAQYSWNRMVWFSFLMVMSFFVVYEFPFVLLGRTKGKLYAASHTEI